MDFGLSPRVRNSGPDETNIGSQTGNTWQRNGEPGIHRSSALEIKAFSAWHPLCVNIALYDLGSSIKKGRQDKMNNSKKLAAGIMTMSLAVTYGQAFAGPPISRHG